MKWPTVLAVLVLIDGGLSWKVFHRGRHEYGNVRPPPYVDGFPDETKFFEQKLDHFNPWNTETWNQRYYENNAFYQEGGPIFLMVGGEGAISPLWAVTGAWIQYAEKVNASIFVLEHRFYGESRPTKDLSVESLKYLNSEQALADCAYFIMAQNEILYHSTKPKWILFGGFYAGSLAAWMRMKYPHLVHGAVASSAPVLAELDFKDYFQSVKNSLSNYDSKCVTAIKKGTNQLILWLKNYLGRKTVNKIFKLCTSCELNTPQDDANFFLVLANNFAEVVQTQNVNSQKRTTKQDENTIESVCNTMLDSTLALEINKLAMVNYMLLGENNETCLDFKYNKMIMDLRSTNWTNEAAEGRRQWMYQSCTEFGHFQTTSSPPIQKMFGQTFTVEFFANQCTDVFGPNYDGNRALSGIARTNMIYGGQNAPTTNVIYVYGSMDPWQPLGMKNVQEKRSETILIEGVSHCADMYPPSRKDPAELTAARSTISNTIERWAFS